MPEILSPTGTAPASVAERLEAIAQGMTPTERVAGTQHLASVVMPAFRAWCERHEKEAAKD